MHIITVPSKSIVTARPIPLFLQYTEYIWGWDEKMNMRQAQNFSFYFLVFTDVLNYLENNTFGLRTLCVQKIDGANYVGYMVILSFYKWWLKVKYIIKRFHISINEEFQLTRIQFILTKSKYYTFSWHWTNINDSAKKVKAFQSFWN